MMSVILRSYQDQRSTFQIEKGKSFIFTADVATKPEVKLGEYKGMEVDKYLQA